MITTQARADLFIPLDVFPLRYRLGNLADAAIDSRFRGGFKNPRLARGRVVMREGVAPSIELTLLEYGELTDVLQGLAGVR